MLPDRAGNPCGTASFSINLPPLAGESQKPSREAKADAVGVLPTPHAPLTFSQAVSPRNFPDIQAILNCFRSAVLTTASSRLRRTNPKVIHQVWVPKVCKTSTVLQSRLVEQPRCAQAPESLSQCAPSPACPHLGLFAPSFLSIFVTTT